MTNKTTKIIIAIAVIASISIPVMGTNLIDAQRQSLDNIPSDVLIERAGAQWVAQYENQDEFTKTREFMREYTQASVDGYNAVVQDAVIKANNFETIVGKRGVNMELVALFAAKQQAQGTYAPTEAEFRYHQWVSEKHPVSGSEIAIDKRIDSLINGQENYALALEIYGIFNEQANIGNVPPELIQTDLKFWAKQGAVANCAIEPDCDPVEMAESFDRIGETTPEQDAEIRARVELDNKEAALSTQSFDFWNVILPKAYAYTEINHAIYMYIAANPCDGGVPCSFNNNGSGTGLIYTTAYSGTVHSVDTSIYAYGTSSSIGSHPNSYHYVQLNMQVPATTNTLLGSGTNGAIKDGYLTKTSVSTLFDGKNTSNAWDP